VKVALTGSGGFIGGHLLEALESSFGDAGVIPIFSRETDYRSSNSPRKGVHIDVISEHEVMDVDYLIHAGAFIPKNKSQANSIDGSIENVIFTRKLMSAPWRRLRKVVHLSTIDVYGLATGVMSEETQPNPQSLYAHSKLFSEKIVESFAIQHHADLQIVRVGHVFGPGEDEYQKLIPTAIRSILRDQVVDLHGDGSARRSYIYVRDLVNGVLRLLRTTSRSGVLNAVGIRPVTVLEVVQGIAAISGKNLMIEIIPTASQVNDAIFLSEKFDRLLEEPQTPFLDALAEEIRYFGESIS
jgi:UDP-glucose 4-epimerase